jgi:hypothetical protein
MKTLITNSMLLLTLLAEAAFLAKDLSAQHGSPLVYERARRLRLKIEARQIDTAREDEYALPIVSKVRGASSS